MFGFLSFILLESFGQVNEIKKNNREEEEEEQIQFFVDQFYLNFINIDTMKKKERERRPVIFLISYYFFRNILLNKNKLYEKGIFK